MIYAVKRGRPHELNKEFILCKTFGKLPSQLDEEDALKMECFALMIDQEAKRDARNAKEAENKAKRGRKR